MTADFDIDDEAYVECPKLSAACVVGMFEWKTSDTHVKCMIDLW
eukprot:CAMPEP_0198346568 /NCGR_PEP_ID=MMETSP1450-20131203/80356_1 /TAXON_ID=753684 ORGANISM="Madagascaria erythrocladiodes, Strain CCMP3234" /NCGR_SAMPLE_ID=MMETSP1450 /ASSEMBLY_ACC=CAM_ASM_001115 /LENGTH=43 /DNA_ID= /DNA_START= /DNA_END= /DNA_ORIENTATION=